MRTGMQYSDRYTTKSSIDGILEEYEKSIEIFKEKLWKKGTGEFDHSTRTYAINKILQLELFEPKENNTKEECSSKNKVVGKKHCSEKKLKTPFYKKEKKSLKGTTQVVEVNDARLESTPKIDSIKIKAINKGINTRTTCEKILNSDKTAEKTLTKLTYSITNLHTFRNDLEEIKNNEEVYRTVYEIINKLGSEKDKNNIFIFNSLDNIDPFDIEAANKYILSIIEDFTYLIQKIKQYRGPLSEDIIPSKLKNIYNRRIEAFCEQTENDSIQNFEIQNTFFEIRDIVERMKLSSPFSEFPDDNKEILIGNQAQELRILFEGVCRLSLINPLMTAIVGRTGSGKTHFLKNLEYDSTCNKSKRLVLVYELKNKIPNNLDEIIDYIYLNENFRKLLSHYSIELNDPPTRDSRIHEINNSIDRITGVIKEKFSLCFAVDGIDKYFQEIDPKNESDTRKINEEMRSLLGTFRLILDRIDNACIIFSLDPKNYKKMIEVARSDQTLRRRIIIPNGVNGIPLEFEKLNEKEANELVSKFMELWIEKNNIDKKYINGYTAIWPFEQKAISIAWKATPSIGGFIFILNETLKDKLNKKIISFEDLKISGINISRVLFQNRLNYYFADEHKGKKGIWNEIEILARENEIKGKLQAINKNLPNTPDNDELANSFEIYFQELGFVREVRKKDLIIYSEIYGNKKIYIKFIYGSKITIIDARYLAEYLKDSNSGVGLFVCIGETDSGEIKWDLKCEEYFKDFRTKVNYVSTVGSRLINRAEALSIMKLKEIEKDTRKIYAEYLDRKLGFKPYLESLEFTETSKIEL
jgi:hypothetical protein